jgi:hypothetical protein
VQRDEDQHDQAGRHRRDLRCVRDTERAHDQAGDAPPRRGDCVRPRGDRWRERGGRQPDASTADRTVLAHASAVVVVVSTSTS